MQQTASVHWADVASFWHVGGLAWQASAIKAPDAAVAVIGPASAPVAWAWIVDGSHLNAFVRDTDNAGARALTTWFTTAATADSTLTATVPSGSSALAAALTAADFAPATDSPYSVDLRCETATRIEAPLPSGYRLRPLRDSEQAQLVACHRDAWNPHRLPWPPAHRPALAAEAASSFTEAAFAEVEATWPYRRDLVIVVESDDGSFAASCIAWLDETNGVAEVEPLGVVPEHRGRGLGRALIAGAVEAVRRAGGTEVTIHPRGDDAYPAARRLYESCGFRAVGRTLAMRRPAR